MVQIKELKINIGDFSCRVEELNIGTNDIFILYGSNGSGKTLLLNTILGLVKYQGKITIKGIDHKKENYKKFTGVFIDAQYLIPYLTAKEYFKFYILLSNYDGKKGKQNIEKYSNILEFNSFNKKIENLSLGNQKKVGLISSLITEPQLILWDEPFSNLDDQTCRGLNNILKDFNKNSKTILYTAHSRENFFNTNSFELK